MVKKLLNPATGEVIDLPAFPSVQAELGAQAMTLRDYFAAKLPSDEIQELTFRNMSRDAQELLTGMKYPIEPQPTYPGAMPPVDYRIAVVRFHAAVNAALRYLAADAMLKERAK